jgi:hypothetical protein
LLRQPTKFSDEEIDEFQELEDQFYKKWIYLTVHQNLYKFSQQNLESLNEKMKVTYFQNTQWGGNHGKNTQVNERSHLLSVLKMFQHELLWLSGIGDEMINAK